MEEKPKEQEWIAVIKPSRGMCFSEVEEQLERIRDTYPRIRIFRSHDLPLYDNFNSLVEEALQDQKYKLFLFNEDDTIIPDKGLDEMLEVLKEHDVAAINYPFNGGWGTVCRSEITGKILFTGFGATLVKREVLESLDKPIFKVDKSFNISNMQWYNNPDLSKIYGQGDIRFGSEIRSKGFTIGQVPGMVCRHLQLIEHGKAETNHGIDIIGEKGPLERELLLPINDL